jgi:hypothetical protein
MISKIQIASHRLRGQKGQEFIMFGLMILFVYTPLLLWMFVMGMSMIVSIQTNNLARDMDNMYIHGTDFSTYGAQQLAQLVATGLDLEFPVFGATGGTTNLNQAKNVGSSGNGLIWVTQVMYVGATTDPLCTSVGASNCASPNSFVYTQQIEFGNSSLTTQKDTSVGYYGGSGITSSGVISAPLTDSTAKLGSTYQTAMKNLWQTTSNGQASLVDGQTIYIVEAFFQTPTLNLGSLYKSPGTYARYFF